MDNMTANTGTPITPATEETKTFTQDDVNRIVQKRLLEEKNRSEEAAATLAKREQEIAQREAAFQKQELESKATARLTAQGLSPDFLPLVDTSSAEAMERTLSIIEKNTPQDAQPRKAMAMRVGGFVPQSDPIRAAMGLKEKNGY